MCARLAQCPRLGIGVEEARQILGGEGMERFIGQEENFDMSSVLVVFSLSRFDVIQSFIS